MVLVAQMFTFQALEAFSTSVVQSYDPYGLSVTLQVSNCRNFLWTELIVSFSIKHQVAGQ